MSEKKLSKEAIVAGIFNFFDDFDFIVEGDNFLNNLIEQIQQVIYHQKGFTE